MVVVTVLLVVRVVGLYEWQVMLNYISGITMLNSALLAHPHDSGGGFYAPKLSSYFSSRKFPRLPTPY